MPKTPMLIVVAQISWTESPKRSADYQQMQILEHTIIRTRDELVDAEVRIDVGFNKLVDTRKTGQSNRTDLPDYHTRSY